MTNPISSIDVEPFTFAVLVIIATSLIYLSLIVLPKRQHANSSSIPKIPGAVPIVGNRIGSPEKFSVKMEEWASKYSKNGIVEMNLYGTRYIIVCDDRAAAKLEAARPFEVTRLPQFEAVFQSLSSQGLFGAEGENWKKDRRIVGPSLSRKNVRDYMSSVKIVTHRLMDKLDSLKASPIAINELLLCATLDIIALVACTADIDSLRQGESNMGNDLKQLFKALSIRTISPVAYWKIPLIGNYLDGGGSAADRLVKTYRKLIRENEELSESEKPNNFLTKVLSLNKDKNSEYAMAEDRLIGNIMTMFAAGSETTQVTLCSALWEIASDESGLQDELAAEALAFKNFDEAGLDEIADGLPRLRSLIYEVLRLRGPTSLIGLQNMKEVEIGGTTFPPNTTFLIALRYISTLDDSDPERLIPLGPNNAPRKEFCPRRWLTTNEDGNTTVQNPSHKSGWRPFGVGMRVCPGRDFAEVEMLIILGSMLRKYEISLKENHPPMTMVKRFTECPDIDICLSLKDRK
mmetsp:Transcript_13208/g.26947  ORF Transcript_13208/g.26947 Transcript_13208/m.26947 type:complete len:518 (+) Transcript_13208:138-1691(+)